MIEMVRAHGYYWPAGSEGYCERYVKRVTDMVAAISRCRGRTTAVQAGGHCGVWPLWLAVNFGGAVYTFEPDARNFACLSRNVSDHPRADRIFASRGLLSKPDTGPLSVSVSHKNIGGHRGTQDAGIVPTYAIDSLKLAACDLIVLDVEGMEVPALLGARETIKKNRPVLMLEDKEHGDRYGWGGSEHLRAVVTNWGYEVVDRASHDIICVSRSG